MTRSAALHAMRALRLLVLAMAVAACSDSPDGAAGKTPSLSKGADEFMKVYGGVESGVTDTTEKKPEEKKTPEEKK
ncbi:MAG: hypothetical protein ACREM3_13735 [Candidatus Rokuibacteriota bacterium]